MRLIALVLLALPMVLPAADPAPADLSSLIAPLVVKHGVPALGGAVIRSSGLQALGVAGLRRAGHPTELVTTGDRWHLGSCTKAMTGVLAAQLIEERTLKWDSRIVESFPKLPAQVDAGRISLEQLLNHRAGLPANLTWQDYAGSDLRAERSRIVQAATARPPLTAPGSATLYSNLGYVIAGAMVEQAAGQPWENALRSRIWIPLGIQNAGFGPANTVGKVDQPWGHDAQGNPVDHLDNPPVMGPAGTVNASLADWGRFIQVVLRGAQGEAVLMKPATWERLLTPGPLMDPQGGDRYANGWIFTERSWAGGRTLTHAGSNTVNFAVVWLAPAKDFAVLATCNSGQANAEAACDEVASALIGWAGQHP